jgi:hypothetical protein
VTLLPAKRDAVLRKILMIKLWKFMMTLRERSTLLPTLLTITVLFATAILKGHHTQFSRLEHPYPVKNQQNIIFGPTTVSDHEVVPCIHLANDLLVQPIGFDFGEPVNEVEL